jgi:MATE family multidrug resistance protein
MYSSPATSLWAKWTRLRGEAWSSLLLALPIVFGQLSSVGMTVVDTVLAGHLDPAVLAAIAVGSAVWSLALVSLLGLMLGLAPLVAERYGAARWPEVGALFRQALWLASAAGIAIGIGLRHARPLLEGFGVAPEVVEQADGFLRALAFGAPAQALYFALRGASEGVGRTRPTLYFGALGLALLLPLGYVLMYGRFGFPRLGAVGCGYATAAALWLQVLCFGTYLARRPHYRPFALFARFELPRPRAIWALLALGLPMGAAVLMEAGLFISVALLIGSLGGLPVAAHQIAINVASVAFMVPLGIGMAATVRVGHALGRGDRSGARWVVLGSGLLVLLAQGVSALLMALVPERIAALYTSDAAVLAQAVVLLRLAALFQVADGIQALANGALRGLQDALWPMAITLLAYWGVGMTLAHALGFGAGQGAPGMWMGLIAGLSVAALLLSLRLWLRLRRA